MCPSCPMRDGHLRRDDINAVPCTWQHIARVYLGLSWAAGTAPQAEARLAGHAELRDSGWRLEKPIS
ncbi:hypothetical protein [Mycolicibacterium hippocampi]|nr:hypothetical protein [Mycolicibacterium hippocampi]